ncbi:hypothetical protein H6F89_26715 [Cyanobacteria bacterium FACHB-63]|nr:hypothetical protein [Cyanobacteria bacterium FACHB-63]
MRTSFSKTTQFSRVTVTIDPVLISPNPVAATEFVVPKNRILVVATTNPILVKTATFTVSPNPAVANGLAVATNGLIFSATIPID